MKKAISLFLLMCLCFSFILAVQEPPKEAGKDDPKKNGNNDKTSTLLGLGFGAAVGFTVFWKQRNTIEDAAIVNGTIRVLSKRNTSAKLMLESHYFFRLIKSEKNGIGPFMALEVVGNTFSTFGAGVMLGFRYDKNAKESFNVGVGLFRDQGYRTLGDGFVENQRAPEGESSIRYKTQGYSGPMLIFSFSFF